MRIFLFLIFGGLTAALIFLLNTPLIVGGRAVPAFGKLLSPQHGLWQNAEAVNEDFSDHLKFTSLKGKVEVYLDDRLVPHIFAQNDNDAYFVQGYLHARFRLWQMELQTLSAAGRASEVVGDIALNHDREFRRLGMVFAAESSLREMETNDTTKLECDAYTAGVNAYIDQLPESQLPIEYKLLSYKPERWSNLKTALFLKYMSYDLAAHESDFEMTNAKSFFSPADFTLLYPNVQDSLDPIIPRGTIYPAPVTALTVPATADSLYFKKDSVHVEEIMKPNPQNGSNNWAVSGLKTKSGAPILCNDPHLGLNLPSLWMEMQISTPSFNAYGASFPGAPAIIIGFNDHCAFGFTNGGRDVRDYFEIRFRDQSRKEYWFDSAWKPTTFRIESIRVKGKPEFNDTVAYTVFGPVMYDHSFSGKGRTDGKGYAVRWTAHDASNELMMFNLLNRAVGYTDYTRAAMRLRTPGQNCVFAAKDGDIAIRTQGRFPAKWPGQGDFIMPGFDSSYLWQYMIPQDETPFQYNPARGFVSSANQRPTDTAYPYYLGREYPSPRGITVNRNLEAMQQITPEDMMALQTNNFNVFAAMALPIFKRNIDGGDLSSAERKYFDLLTSWNFVSSPESETATVFDIAWRCFSDTVFQDEFAKAPQPVVYPQASTLLESVLRDSAFKFLDDITTAEVETLPLMMTRSFRKAATRLSQIEREGRLPWAKYKATIVRHLLRLTPFSRENLPIGGGVNIINATTSDHGPSWRMIVSLTKTTQAYGIYPGGQSGNPGSHFYDNFISDWALGKYYPLWMMKTGEHGDARVRWKIEFSKS